MIPAAVWIREAGDRPVQEFLQPALALLNFGALMFYRLGGEKRMSDGVSADLEQVVRSESSQFVRSQRPMRRPALGALSRRDPHIVKDLSANFVREPLQR